MYTAQDIEEMLKNNALATAAYRAKQQRLPAPAAASTKYTAADVEHILRQNAQIPTASELYRDKLNQQNSAYQGPTSQGRRSSVFGAAELAKEAATGADVENAPEQGGRTTPTETEAYREKLKQMNGLQRAVVDLGYRTLPYISNKYASSINTTLENMYNYLARINEVPAIEKALIEQEREALEGNAPKLGGIPLAGWSLHDTETRKADLAERERIFNEGFKPSRGAMQYAAGLDERFGNPTGLLKVAGNAASMLGGATVPIAANAILPGLEYFVMFLNAAGSVTEEAIAAGASEDKALLTGTTVGSVDAGLNALFYGIPYLGKGFWSKGAIGAAQEMIGGLGKTSAGRYLLGNSANLLGVGVEGGLSTYGVQFIKKIYNGDERSFLQTIAETTPAAGNNALIGMLGYTVLNTVAAVGDVKAITSQGKELQSQKQLLLDEGLTAPKNSAAFKTATELQAKATSGKALSNFELGTLHIENVRALKESYTGKVAEALVRESLEQTQNAAQSADGQNALGAIEQYLPSELSRGITEVDPAASWNGMPDLPGAAGAGKSINKLPKTTAESVSTKLDTYLLEPTHPAGGSKAKWYKEALGFTKDNSADLAKQIAYRYRINLHTQQGIRNPVLPYHREPQILMQRCLCRT